MILRQQNGPIIFHFISKDIAKKQLKPSRANHQTSILTNISITDSQEGILCALIHRKNHRLPQIAKSRSSPFTLNLNPKNGNIILRLDKQIHFLTQVLLH